jgi:long-chain alkane monooxygenase
VAAARKMHLAFILGHGPSQHSIGAWSLPRAYRGLSYSQPQYWEHLGRTLERGTIDMIFLADTYGVFDVYEGSHDAAVRYAVQFPLHDPMPLVPLIARVTRGLGIGVTSSTSYVPPYYAARLLATLDHLAEGRVGWNVVASYGRNPAANFNRIEELSKEERYAQAEEYMQVCYKLWDSWERDALVVDREALVFADPAKVRKIHHHGLYFNVEGPLNVAPSPQGRPVIIQAGSSGPGLAFAGRHAELHFATSASLAGMRAHRARLNEAVRAAGRRPEAVKIFWATSVFIGETRAEALAKEAALRDRVPLRGGLAMMSGHFGVDFSTVPLDRPLRDLGIENTPGLQGVADMLLRDYADLTLRDVALLYGNGMGGLRFVGSAKEVADRLEEAFEAGDGDGFMLRCGVLPGSLDDVVDLLVPELQARQRFRTRYESHTLRDLLAAD